MVFSLSPLRFEIANGSPKQKSTEKSEHALLSSAFLHQCLFFTDQPRKPLWLRIVMKLSRLRVVSSATPTTISRLVPPSWMLIPVRLPRTIGSTATTARKIAPIRVILFSVRVMKSLVGLPGRKPGIEPLLRRRLLAISTGFYWMAT